MIVELYKHQIEALTETQNLNKVAIKGYEGLYEIDDLGNVYSIVHISKWNNRKKVV